MTMSPDGTNLKPLVADRGGAWAPRGRLMAPGSPSSATATSTSSTPMGLGLARITDGSVWDFAPDWSPDGTKIAFSRETTTGGPADVYVMNADGSAQTNMTNNVAFDAHPAWSPDGTRIAFVSNREGVWLPPVCHEPRRERSAAVWGHTAPWFRSGLVARRDASRVLEGHRTALRLQGHCRGRRRWIERACDRVRSSASRLSSPSWSPDGTKIVFERGWKISVVNADGTGLHDLTAGPPLYQSGPAWSPEGDQIVFETDRRLPTCLHHRRHQGCHRPHRVHRRHRRRLHLRARDASSRACSA